jgi:uncharacterized protein
VNQAFEKRYSVEVPKLRYGLNKEVFHLDRSFFEAFEFSVIQEADMQVDATFEKFETHIDARLHFSGHVVLPCDRCLEPYPQKMDFNQRIVFSKDEDLEFETDEVILLDDSVPLISLATDFYDFIHIEIPLRRVPPTEIHLCAPIVLEMLGLNPDGSEREPEVVEEEQEVDAIDPRWQMLRKLKDSTELDQ